MQSFGMDHFTLHPSTAKDNHLMNDEPGKQTKQDSCTFHFYNFNDELHMIQQNNNYRQTKCRFITEDLLVPLIHLSQAEAAAQLNVSVASLKRKLREMHVTWPLLKQKYRHHIESLCCKHSINYILQGCNASSNVEIDGNTMDHLMRAFNSTLMHEEQHM